MTEQATRVVLHAGCGKLGIGAVIPFLHAAFPNTSIVLVQRREPHWTDIDDGSTCHLENDSGFYRPYRVHLVLTPDEVTKLIGIGEGDPQDHLILVKTLGLVDVILRRIGTPPLCVSCSLGEGQADLALPLRAAKDQWSHLYAFENSVDTRSFEPLLDEDRVHHVVVDRICWEAGSPQELPRGVSGRNRRRAHCEKKFAAFWIPSEKGMAKETIMANGEMFGLDPKWLKVEEYRTATDCAVSLDGRER